jgi:hypothetical protein
MAMAIGLHRLGLFPRLCHEQSPGILRGRGLIRFPYQVAAGRLARRLRPRLWQRRKEALSHHHRACGLDPGKPCKPHGLGPKGKGVPCVDRAGKGLKGGRCLEIDRDLLRQTVGRMIMNDLDVETRHLGASNKPPGETPGGGQWSVVHSSTVIEWLESCAASNRGPISLLNIEDLRSRR